MVTRAHLVCSRQSNQALGPRTKTPPPGSSVQDTPANRSPSLRERLTQASSWPSASTLKPSRGRSRSRGQVRRVFWTQIDTSGGATETEVNELAAIPTGSPSTIAQTAITPDGKQPNTRRSSALVNGGEARHASIRSTNAARAGNRAAAGWSPWALPAESSARHRRPCGFRSSSASPRVRVRSPRHPKWCRRRTGRR